MQMKNQGKEESRGRKASQKKERADARETRKARNNKVRLRLKMRWDRLFFMGSCYMIPHALASDGSYWERQRFCEAHSHDVD